MGCGIKGNVYIISLSIINHRKIKRKNFGFPRLSCLDISTFLSMITHDKIMQCKSDANIKIKNKKNHTQLFVIQKKIIR